LDSYKGRSLSLLTRAFTAALAIHPITSLAAQATNEFETEEDFFAEVPSVISATRIRQPLTEVPASVTVIDRDMIEASGAIEVADIFRLVPGVQVSYPQGNQIAVAYHGFSDAFPRNMQILVDGRSVYQPTVADVDWVFLGVTLENIDRIEVVRGPNSPLYGANSVQGVINIITTQPYQVKGTHIGVTGGSLDTRNGIFRYADNLSKMDYRVTLTYEENSGLPGNADSTNDDRQVGGVSFRGVIQQNFNNEIDIQMGLKSGDLGAGAQIPDNPLPHEKQVSANYFNINWRHTFNDGGDSQLQFYRNANDSVDDYPQLISEAFDVPAAIVPGIIGQPDQIVQWGIYTSEGERYDLEWQYTSAKKGNWQTVLGAGARQNRVKAIVADTQGEWIEELSYRTFANINYQPTESIIAGLGVMAETSNQFGEYISPRLSINYLLSPEHAFRFSYTNAQRNPSLVESNFKYDIKLQDGTEFLNLIRNLDPQPETKTSSEIGFIGYWLNRTLLLDMKIFQEITDDVIHEMESTDSQAYPIPQVITVFDNDGRLKVEGFEMQLKYQVAAKDFISVQYSNLDAQSTLKKVNGGTELWDRPEKSVPEHTFSALLSHGFARGYEASIAYYYLSEMYWLGSGTLVDNYQRWDLRLAKDWRIKNNHYKAELIAQNIGDDYVTFEKDNIFETRIYLRLSVDL